VYLAGQKKRQRSIAGFRCHIGEVIMLKYFIIPFALVGGLSVIPGAVTAAEVWTAEGFKNPESVLYDPDRQIFYVSNVNGAPTDKDGAGHISKLSTDGTLQEAEWVTGLDAPKGLVMRGDQLFVSDIDRLVAIDVNTGEIAGTWDAEGAKFLNDPAVSDDGRVFVSDMLINAIYVLDGETLSLWLQDEALQHPNGLRIEDGRLLIAPWGKEIQQDFSTKVPGHMIAVDLASKAISTVGSGVPVGNLDGLEPDGQGNWLVTDWVAGALHRIKADGSSEILVDLNQGSADLEVIDNGALAVIPMMMDNKVVAHTTK
jgi:sugar lactone lactonase YvrE